MSAGWNNAPNVEKNVFSAQDVRRSDSGASTSSAQRRSILDPHESVMDLLNRQQNGMSNPRGMQLEPGLLDELNQDIRHLTDSWQAIDSDEYSFLRANTNIQNNRGSLPDTTTQDIFANAELNLQFGGVLSSDTSEEETEMMNAPSPNITSSQQFNHVSSSTSYGEQVHQYTTSEYNVNKKGKKTAMNNQVSSSVANTDDETIMVNLGQSWTSSFFVMPKLSLSQSMKRFKILLLSDGDSAKSFYNRLSRYHQMMFDVRKLDEVSKEESQKYTAFMIIFSDAKKVNSTLNRIWSKYGTFTLIPICQKGQKQSVTEFVRSYAALNRVKLMSYPVVISDHYEIHGLLRHLHSLYVEVDSDYDTDIPKKSKAKKNSKKKAASYFTRKWWFWPISIAIGVGIGCCMTLYFGKYDVAVNRPPIDILQVSDNDVDKLVEMVEGSSNYAIEDTSPQTIPEFAKQVCKLVKETALQFNDLLKQFLSSHVMTFGWAQSIGKDLIQSDPSNVVTKATALDLILF